jgi:glycopeptide antibiotics resistance protein
MIIGFERTTLPEYAYNLRPFANISYLLWGKNISLSARIIVFGGNIILFIPYGILLPLLFKRKFKTSIIVFLIGLFCLESLQLITKRGHFDIDDFILNTVGFLIGYWVYNKRLLLWYIR